MNLTSPAKGIHKHQGRTGIVKSINFDLQTDTPINEEFMHSSTRK
jgi:hypothetical protein